MSVQTWIPLLLMPALLTVCVQGMRIRTTDSISTLTCFRRDRSQIQITEGFFRQKTVPARCNRSCSPTNHSASALVCKKGPGRGQCRALFSDDDLNQIYKAVDSGFSARLKETAEMFDQVGPYKISYICLNKGQHVVDPCADHQPEDWQDQQFTSLLVSPNRSRFNKHQLQQQQCRTICVLKPAGHFRLKVNFLLKEGQNRRQNFLRYKVVSRHGRTSTQTAWLMPSSYRYVDHTDLYTDVQELRIHLHLEDLSMVTRLWLSFADEPREFSVSCTSIIARNSTQQDKRTEEDGVTKKDTHILAAGLGVVGLILLILSTTFVVIRCQRHRQSRNKLTQGNECSGTHEPWRNPTAQSTQSDEGVYIELNDAVYTEISGPAVNVDDRMLCTSRCEDALLPVAVTKDTISDEGTCINDTAKATSGHLAEDFETLPYQKTTESGEYSKPQIYMNAPDYQPYTRFNDYSQAQDTPSDLYSEAY